MYLHGSQIPTHYRSFHTLTPCTLSASSDAQTVDSMSNCVCVFMCQVLWTQCAECQLWRCFAFCSQPDLSVSQPSAQSSAVPSSTLPSSLASILSSLPSSTGPTTLSSPLSSTLSSSLSSSLPSNLSATSTLSSSHSADNKQTGKQKGKKEKQKKGESKRERERRESLKGEEKTAVQPVLFYERYSRLLFSLSHIRAHVLVLPLSLLSRFHARTFIRVVSHSSSVFLCSAEEVQRALCERCVKHTRTHTHTHCFCLSPLIQNCCGSVIVCRTILGVLTLTQRTSKNLRSLILALSFLSCKFT